MGSVIGWGPERYGGIAFDWLPSPSGRHLREGRFHGLAPIRSNGGQGVPAASWNAILLRRIYNLASDLEVEHGTEGFSLVLHSSWHRVRGATRERTDRREK